MCNETYSLIRTHDSSQRINLINHLATVVEDIRSCNLLLRQLRDPFKRQPVMKELQELTRIANNLRAQIARTR